VTKAIAGICVAAALFPLLLILLVTAATGSAPATAPAASSSGLSGAATAVARAAIPAGYLVWYMDAAETCPGLPWSVLAGIGTVETGNGQSTLPGVHSGANFAGAEGPMQFEPATFAEYATGPDKPLSPYDPADAIYTAAAMLCASGARSGTTPGIEQAVFAYNHASWYVSEVMSWATRYADQNGGSASAPAATQPGKPRQPASAAAAAPACGSRLGQSSRCRRPSPATLLSSGWPGQHVGSSGPWRDVPWQQPGRSGRHHHHRPRDPDRCPGCQAMTNHLEERS